MQTHACCRTSFAFDSVFFLFVQFKSNLFTHLFDISIGRKYALIQAKNSMVDISNEKRKKKLNKIKTNTKGFVTFPAHRIEWVCIKGKRRY